MVSRFSLCGEHKTNCYKNFLKCDSWTFNIFWNDTPQCLITKEMFLFLSLSLVLHWVRIFDSSILSVHRTTWMIWIHCKFCVSVHYLEFSSLIDSLCALGTRHHALFLADEPPMTFFIDYGSNYLPKCDDCSYHSVHPSSLVRAVLSLQVALKLIQSVHLLLHSWFCL